MWLPVCASTIALTALAASAQVSRNVQLLGQYTPASSSFSDVWGYTDPATGKEYCLMGSLAGTHIVDCSDPTSPTEVGLIPTDAPFTFWNAWRDIKTVGTYAYIVSEAHGGMQIVDLTNPAAATKVKTWGSWSGAHNIAADPEAGLVYVCGTGSGTYVVDVATDPVNPAQLFVLGSPYIHDLSVADGVGYFMDQNGNNLNVYDTSSPGSLPLLGSGRMPGASVAHASWPSRDGTVCIASNEANGGPISIWDISNKRMPMLLKTYTAGPSSAIPHNPFIRDRVAHISYYTEGYRSLDLSDPTNPVEVGYYDTSTFPAGGYNGAWGCYPFQPSGVVYITDIENGLYVLKPASSAERYGPTTTGSAGATPQIYAFGSAYAGNASFKLEVDGAPTSRPGVMVLAAGRGSTTVGSLTVNVAIGASTALVPIASDPNGQVSVPLPVPAGIAVGGTLNVQMLFADSTQALDLSGTQGLEFDVFAK